MLKIRAEIENAFKELGFKLEPMKEDEGYVSRLQGNNVPKITTFITIDSKNELIQIASTLEAKVGPEKQAQALNLINFIHGRSIWAFRHWMDPEDGSVMTMGGYSFTGGHFRTQDFNENFMACVRAADRIYPCLMAVSYGDKQPEEAFASFYFQKKVA